MKTTHSERGAVSVEFALISLLLFTILFGIIQFGLFFNRYLVYSGAAREGARVASVRGDADQIRLRVHEAIGGDKPGEQVPLGDIIIEPSDGCTDDTVGDKVEVYFDRTFGDDADPFAFAFIPFRVDVRMSGVFRCE